MATRDDNAAWSIIGYLLSGLLFWGGVGWGGVLRATLCGKVPPVKSEIEQN